MPTLYEILGTLFTISAAALAYLRSTAQARKLNAVFMTLLGVVFTMLFSLRFDTLPRIEEHLVIAETLNQSPRVLGYVDGLSRAEDVAAGADNPLMGYMLNTRLDQLERHLRLLKDGQFVVRPDEFSDFSLRLIASAERSYLATSYIALANWWETDWGRLYEERNIEKAKGGVNISRIFIFSNPGEFERSKKYLDYQSRNGIKIKTVVVQNLDLRLASDMVVVDNELAGELVLTPDKGIKEGLFFTERRDVERIIERIEQLDLRSAAYVSNARPK